MPAFTTTGETPVTLHYTDTGGDGRPVVLIHGWPLSADAWAKNVPALIDAGCRVVAYDRRGFGQSSKPDSGYDYDTLAADLSALMEALGLRGAVIVGFSMGGGEVARYIANHGTQRLAGAVLAASITPGLGITEANPDGAGPYAFFETLAEQCEADRPGFLDAFMHAFFSTANGQKVPESDVAVALAIAAQGSDAALPACIRIWPTDFQDDLRGVDVPLLVIHGDGDQTVPFSKSAARIQGYVPHAVVNVVADGPHGINVSHVDEFNAALVDFISGLEA